jgi:hypothetical protein
MNKPAAPAHVASLLMVPTCVTLVCGFSAAPPTWFRASRPRQVAVAAPAPVAPRLSAVSRKPIPRILAVDAHIAKRVNDLRPGVKSRLEKVVHRLSPRITLLVTSAARTRAEQASLHPTFGIKAKPGTSAHEDGRAIDVNVLVDGERISPRLNNAIIGSAMASEGFINLGRRDPVHYSLPKADLSHADYTPGTRGPELDVMSMHEVREIQADEARTIALNSQASASETPAALMP